MVLSAFCLACLVCFHLLLSKSYLHGCTKHLCGSQTPQTHLDNILRVELLSIILSVPIVHRCLQSFISIVFSSFRCSPNHHWLLSLALLAFAEVFEIENTIKKPVSFFESYWQKHKSLHGRRLLFKECYTTL